MCWSRQSFPLLDGYWALTVIQGEGGGGGGLRGYTWVHIHCGLCKSFPQLHSMPLPGYAVSTRSLYPAVVLPLELPPGLPLECPQVGRASWGGAEGADALSNLQPPATLWPVVFPSVRHGPLEHLKPGSPPQRSPTVYRSGWAWPPSTATGGCKSLPIITEEHDNHHHRIPP